LAWRSWSPSTSPAAKRSWSTPPPASSRAARTDYPPFSRPSLLPLAGEGARRADEGSPSRPDEPPLPRHPPQRSISIGVVRDPANIPPSQIQRLRTDNKPLVHPRPHHIPSVIVPMPRHLPPLGNPVPVQVEQPRLHPQPRQPRLLPRLRQRHPRKILVPIRMPTQL